MFSRLLFAAHAAAVFAFRVLTSDLFDGSQSRRSRCLPSCARASRSHAEDRTFDGTGNNLANPLWGSAGTDYSREASGAHYADSISAPQVAGLPEHRAVSNSLMTQGEDSVLDPRGLTAMVYTWGQFIDHDMDLRTSSAPPVAFNIPVPIGDPSFDPTASGTQVIPVSRSGIDPLTGTSAANPAQQINSITSYLDASMVYGSNATRATWLRTLSGGLLKSTAAPTGACCRRTTARKWSTDSPALPRRPHSSSPAIRASTNKSALPRCKRS